VKIWKIYTKKRASNMTSAFSTWDWSNIHWNVSTSTITDSTTQNYLNYNSNIYEVGASGARQEREKAIDKFLLGIAIRRSLELKIALPLEILRRNLQYALPNIQNLFWNTSQTYQDIKSIPITYTWNNSTTPPVIY
jgi:hypothetical protein